MHTCLRVCNAQEGRGARKTNPDTPLYIFETQKGRGGGVPTTTGCRRHGLLPRSPQLHANSAHYLWLRCDEETIQNDDLEIIFTESILLQQREVSVLS